MVAKVMVKKGDSKKNIYYHYIAQEVPHPSILNTECIDLEMMEDTVAVRDTGKDDMEDEGITTEAVRLIRKEP